MAANWNTPPSLRFSGTTNGTFTLFVSFVSTTFSAINNFAQDVYWKVRNHLFGDEPLLRFAKDRRGFPLIISRIVPECVPAAAFFTLAPAMVGGGEARRRWR